MIRYFCDRCGTEISPFEYKTGTEVTISGTDETDTATYHVCSDCGYAIRHFVKNNDNK